MTERPGRSAWQAGRDVVAELYARNRVLCVVALANLGLAVLFTVLLFADGRTLLGRNVWAKPWKFATSIAIFTATLGWLLPSLSLTDRVERLATTVVGGAMAIEIALITTQAARGVASHFNDSTALDEGIYVVMGVTITISSAVVAYVLWEVLRRPPDLAPAYLWGIGLGMFVFVLASFEGWLMVSQGSHAVGAATDGPGLPLLNWSVTGGDLRVAHFVGLHALQVLPLTGYVAATWDRLSPRGSLLTVAVVAMLYSGFTVVTFVQAMAGHPLVASAIAPWLSPAILAGLLLIGVVCATLGLALSCQRGTRQRYGPR